MKQKIVVDTPPRLTWNPKKLWFGLMFFLLFHVSFRGCNVGKGGSYHGFTQDQTITNPFHLDFAAPFLRFGPPEPQCLWPLSSSGLEVRPKARFLGK